jgi:broad specificity phosphatase PhoE
MSIVIVRHGETALNAARILQPLETPLGERGLVQAAAVGRRLAGTGVEAILSSDLPRALQTAQAIAAASGATIEGTPLLQERSFGDLRGRPYDTIGFDPLTMAGAPPGGEPVAAFLERVAAAFALAVRRRAAMRGTLVVVTHGLVVRALIEHHITRGAGVDLPAQVRNTSVTIVDAQAPHGASLIDCVRHLDETTAPDTHGLSGG